MPLFCWFVVRRADGGSELRVLEGAEAVILQQRQRIETLQQLVQQQQQQLRGVPQRHQKQEAKYQRQLAACVQENQQLRLEVDAAKGEIAALHELRRRHQSENEQLLLQVAAAEKGISERDSLIRTLKVSGYQTLHRSGGSSSRLEETLPFPVLLRANFQERDKTAENDALRAERQRLLHEVECLKRTAAPFAGGVATASGADDVGASKAG